MKNSNRKQRFFILTLVLLGMAVGGAFLIPRLVNVDSYRPPLEQWANEKLNGTLSLGKLELSLWGKIAVKVERAELLDLNRKPILSVGEFELVVPLLKLISASPEVQVRMVHPQIRLERNQKGALNIAQLIQKTSAPEEGESEKKEVSAGKKTQDEMPSWAKRAGLSLSIQDADLKFTDQKNQSEYELKKVAVKTGLLSLETLPTFSVSAEANTQIGTEGRIRGPFTLKAQSKNGGIFLQGDLSQLEIDWNKSFQKKAGGPLTLSAQLSQDQNRFRIQEGQGVFEKVKLSFEGDFTPAEGEKSPDGHLSLKLSGLPFRGPHFKQDLEISGEAKLSFEGIEKSTVQLKGKGFDLEVNTQVRSFSEPKVRVDISSSQMDLDELLDWKAMKEAKKIKTEEALQIPPKKASGSPAKESSPAQKATGTVGVQMKALKAYNVLIEPIRGTFTLKNQKLLGAFEEAKVLGGRLNLSLGFDALPEEIHYQFQGQVKEVSLEKAVASQVEWLKNTVVGSLQGEISGKGFGLNAEKAKQNLKMTGKIQVKPAKLSTIDINEIISQGVTSAISKAGDKIPGLKGKQLKMDPVASDFQQINASFTVSDGMFYSPDFYAQAVPEKGLEAKGTTRLDIRDYSIDARWEISDPYNLLKMKEVAVEEGGVRVESILLERGKAFHFPVRVKGNLFKPEYDYGAIPEVLAGIALKNLSLAVQDRAKGELKKQAEEKLKQVTEKAPPQVQQILKGIFK